VSSVEHHEESKKCKGGWKDSKKAYLPLHFLFKVVDIAFEEKSESLQMGKWLG